MKLEISTDFRKIYAVISFFKTNPVEAQLFHDEANSRYS